MNNSGFAYISGSKIRKLLHDPDTSSFSSFWEDLPVDQYLPLKKRYRKRRYCRFLYKSKTGRLIPLEHLAFYQDESVNKVYGGMHRYFEPSTDEFVSSPVLNKLIKHDLRYMSLDNNVSWEISVQQIRVTATNSENNLPAPEGLHRDGFMYVWLHLINRSNIVGGENVISNGKNVLFRKTLTNFFDSIFIKDNEVLHGVSSITSTTSNVEGFRDMLIINIIKPIEDNNL